MGQQLTYEIGLLNLGRRVRVSLKDGAGSLISGTLTMATKKAAHVKADGRGSTAEYSWDQVQDWTSHNSGALKLPTPAPKPTLRPATVQPPPPAKVVSPPADPFDVFSGLSERLNNAMSEVRAAEDLVDSALEQLQAAKAEHAEAVARLKGLRTDAAAALGHIDNALVGTSAATH